MFTVSITLSEWQCQGIEALDKRRAWGIREGTHISLGDPNQSGIRWRLETETSEEFARAWFRKDLDHSSCTIPVELLAKGDVAQCEANNYAVGFAELTPERTKELYVAARFHATRQQVERLTEERDELFDKLEELEA